MTDAIQTENARTLGHFVSMRDAILALGPTLFGHTQAVPELHFGRPVLDDLLLVARNYVTRINEVIQRIDPNAEALPLAPPPPSPPAPGTPGTMLVGDELEALRSQRIGQVVQQARTLADDRFTVAEATRLQQLQSQMQAAQADAAPPLTDEEIAELNALDADRIWAVTVQDEANARVTSLLTADAATLAAYQPQNGWPE